MQLSLPYQSSLLGEYSTMCVIVTIVTLFTSMFLVCMWLYRRPKVEDLVKKGVFITGCDSGFGRALALRLDSMGVPVFAGCFTEEGAEELNYKTSDTLHTILIDLRDSNTIQRAYEFVRHSMMIKGTALWGVVNNAGITGAAGPLEFLDRKEFEHVMSVNFLGAMDVTSCFLPLLKKSKGRIVNTSSVEAFLPMPLNLAYTASKFAMQGYTDSLRLEKRQWGISVHCIQPGMYKTGILDIDSYKERKRMQWEAASLETREEYGEDYLRETVDIITRLIDRLGKDDLEPVVDAYEHALFAKNPKDEYVIGWDAKLMLMINKLPTFCRDAVIRYFMSGPTPKALQHGSERHNGRVVSHAERDVEDTYC